MDFLCFVLALLAFFIGIPASLIWLIIAACMKKDKRNPLTMLAGCFAGTIVLMLGAFSLSSYDESEVADSGDVVVEETKEDSDAEEKAKAEKEKAEKEKAEKEKANKFEYADTNIKYLKSKVGYDASDDKCLYVYFEFTNNSDENESFASLVRCQAFQNGIELETNYLYDCDEERNSSKDIQPGASITVAEIFELDDSTEDITLEVRPFSIWSDRLLFEKEIKISE